MLTSTKLSKQTFSKTIHKEHKTPSSRAVKGQVRKCPSGAWSFGPMSWWIQPGKSSPQIQCLCCSEGWSVSLKEQKTMETQTSILFKNLTFTAKTQQAFLPGYTLMPIAATALAFTVCLSRAVFFSSRWLPASGHPATSVFLFISS